MNAAVRIPRDLYPFEGRFFERDGLRLHHLDEGAGPPLVMLHGNPTWSFCFRNLVLALRDDHRVIAPDQIGCGLSDKPDDTRYDYTLARRTDDLEALLEAIAPGERVTLVGHDWGGLIGMAWAARHPERVARLVLMNTAAFRLPEGLEVPASMRFLRDSRLGALSVLHANLFCRAAAWLAPARRMPRAVRRAYCAPYDTPDHRRATLRFVQDVPLDPAHPSYEALCQVERGLALFARTPTLLLWGMRDRVLPPKVLEVFEKTWPHAEVHRFANAGHYLLEDVGDEIAARMRDFLARHPA